MLHKAGEIGFGAIYCQEEFGGSALGRLEASVVFEQLAQGCVSTGAYISIHKSVSVFLDISFLCSSVQFFCTCMPVGWTENL